MKKGSIVGLIIVILVGIGLYKLYLYYPTWSAEKEAKKKMEREELIELANSEMKYIGSKNQEFDNQISLLRSADGNDEGDYYLIDCSGGIGKCYLTSKEQINAICKLDFEENPEEFNSEPLEVEKSQSRGMDCIRDVYDSKYDRTFKKIIYDGKGEKTGEIHTILNHVDKTDWLEGDDVYSYDKLFGGNMLEFYKANELYTKVLDIKLLRTYLFGCPAYYYIALDCEVEVETLSAKEGFEGEYGIPKVGETNIIKVSILGKNMQFFGMEYEPVELCLRE